MVPRVSCNEIEKNWNCRVPEPNWDLVDYLHQWFTLSIRDFLYVIYIILEFNR